ncbi:hypothetical protein A8B78_22310 [Jannaschia sp. EhC01]|nr:hypothetical protein A8B78_22310 [Jannaschia sp. EhC01]
MLQTLPPGWREVTLEDVCERVTVGHVGPMANEYVEAGVPFLRSQNVQPFRINTNDIRYITDAFDAKLRKSALRPSDVVVVRTGYPGTAAVIPNHMPSANCADLVVITPSAELDPWFLTCIFNSVWGKDTVAGNLVGVAQQHFNVGAAKAMKIGLPPLPTQQRIAAILSAYDDLIENNTRRIAILEEMARRLYEEWFVATRPRVDEDSGDWTWTTLGHLCASAGGSVQTGPFGSQLHQRDYRTEGTVVVMPKDLRDGRIDHDRCACISPEDAERLAKHRLQEFDIVFGRRGEIGRKALVRPHEAGALCGTGCLKVSLGSLSVSPFYVSEYLSEEQTVESLAGRAIGATMPNLNTRILAETKVPLPKGILLQQYHEIVSTSDQITTVLHRKNANLRTQRDLLLPKLVSGEIDVSGAEVALEAAE